jgi:hypothetical protein
MKPDRKPVKFMTCKAGCAACNETGLVTVSIHKIGFFGTRVGTENFRAFCLCVNLVEAQRAEQ